MNNSTAEVIMTAVVNTTINITNNITHTSDVFRIIPMSLLTYFSLAVFKLYNSLF